MNDQLTKQLSSYKRSLEDRKVQSTIYTILILLTIFLFDVYGIYSLVQITKTRHETLQKLDNLNSDLAYKKNQTDILKQKLEESRVYLEMLERVVPKKPLLEEYMVNLVNIAAKYGYKQEKLVRNKGDDNYLELRVTFVGQENQFVPFIDSIEAIDRLAVIDRIKYEIEEGEVNLDLSLRIYYLER